MAQQRHTDSSMAGAHASGQGARRSAPAAARHRAPVEKQGASAAGSAAASHRQAGSKAATRTGAPVVSYTSHARQVSAARAAVKRRRRRNRILGVAVLAACLLAVVLALRGLFGCVGARHAVPGGTAAGTGAGVVTDAVTPEGTAAAGAPATQAVDVNLVMIGDILQHRDVFQSGYQDDGSRVYDHVFAHILGELEGADIKVVNQETLLGGTAFEFSGYPSFNGPQEMGDAEARAGFNVVLRATNHAMDMGYAGLSSELSYWKREHPEVAVLGAADPDDPTTSIDDVYVFEKDGFKVALLNYTYDLNGYEDPYRAVSTLDWDHVRTTVTKAHEMADMVVVFPHWGEEYSLQPVQEQYDMAQLFMDCGADVIIGGHPHVIEPVQVLTASDGRKVPCFWSVGNFISTQVDNMNLIGGVAKVTLHKDADGSCRVTAASFTPTVTHKGYGTDMTTYLLRDWNDDLAATNYSPTNATANYDLNVAWGDQFCTDVLGPGYDATAHELVIDPASLVPGEPVASAAGQDAGDAANDTANDDAYDEELDEAA